MWGGADEGCGNASGGGHTNHQVRGSPQILPWAFSLTWLWSLRKDKRKFLILYRRGQNHLSHFTGCVPRVTDDKLRWYMYRRFGMLVTAPA